MKALRARLAELLERVNWRLWGPLGGAALGGLLLLALIVGIVPRLRAVNAGVRELAAVEAQVVAEQRRQEEAILTERAKLSRVQAAQAQRLAALLSPAEAAAVVDALYATASASTVEIVELQHSTQDAEGAVFARYLLQMQVVGALPDLLKLIAQAREAVPSAGFVISKLGVEEQAGQHVLRAEMLLYVSRAGAAPGAAAPAPTLRAATPAPTPSASAPTNTPTPTATPTLGPGQTRAHVVQPGDTLYSLSLQYGVAIEAIIDANDLNSPQIRPGDWLVIP